MLATIFILLEKKKQQKKEEMFWLIYRNQISSIMSKIS